MRCFVPLILSKLGTLMPLKQKNTIMPLLRTNCYEIQQLVLESYMVALSMYAVSVGYFGFIRVQAMCKRALRDQNRNFCTHRLCVHNRQFLNDDFKQTLLPLVLPFRRKWSATSACHWFYLTILPEHSRHVMWGNVSASVLRISCGTHPLFSSSRDIGTHILFILGCATIPIILYRKY